jgi:large subunit ribosomal protein L19
MNTIILNKIEEKYIIDERKDVKVGDTIKVHSKIVEGEKERIQIYQGIVLARKHSGTHENIIVRKISKDVGVERIFPLHSPNISKIEIVKRGKVRRAQINYMRKRIGKRAMLIKEKHETIPSRKKSNK